jgi:nucleotide-binding universal stress UspA family protein
VLQIHNVLCPIDFSDVNIRELELAVDVCRSFGAHLILHHNVHASPLGASTSWMWTQEHSARAEDEDGAAGMLREILAELPLDVDAEARLSSGLAAPAILQLREQTGADLVIMATHGASTEDHTSVTDKVIANACCPVLVWQGEDHPPLRLEASQSGSEAMEVLVPTDLTPSSATAVAYAFDLARALPLRLHLLHVLTPGRSVWVLPGVSPSMPADPEADPFLTARQDLELLVPEDLRHRTCLHVETGDPAEQIAEASRRLGVSCIVMGSHARGLLRGFFTHDTSRDLLHQAACPVWFVPASQAA